MLLTGMKMRSRALLKKFQPISNNLYTNLHSCLRPFKNMVTALLTFRWLNYVLNLSVFDNRLVNNTQTIKDDVRHKPASYSTHLRQIRCIWQYLRHLLCWIPEQCTEEYQLRIYSVLNTENKIKKGKKFIIGT
jgi:hypothetical protein